MLRLLTVTTLYPNEEQIRHGVFVEQRLRRLVETGDVEARVIAPVPWFPFGSPRFGKYAEYARVPRRETRWGIEILHPRYLMIPKVGMLIQPFLLAASIWFAVQKFAREGFQGDVIDAHYFFPDGVSAAIVAGLSSKPLVITARGSDVNLIAQMRLPRLMIKWAARKCDAIIAVSEALKSALTELGVSSDKISVLRNGVDLLLFRPRNDNDCVGNRGALDCELLSVGNLKRAKGHHLAIESLRYLSQARLNIVGEGPERKNLERMAEELGVAGRVKFSKSVSQDKLLSYYHLADVLVLASAREGMPNVVLEALACGIPVVATAVGGIPEVVNSEEAGILISERSAEAIAAAVTRLVENRPNCSRIRRHAEQFGWDGTTRRQLALYRGIAVRDDGF